jgi:CrcB protein
MPIVIGIAVAGALGALARYGLDELIGRRTGAFPWGIFVVNVTGAFLIGFMVEALEPRFEDSWVRAAVVTGFLGAYTTFSTFTNEAVGLIRDDRVLEAAAYVGVSTGLGLVVAAAGISAAHRFAS